MINFEQKQINLSKNFAKVLDINPMNVSLMINTKKTDINRKFPFFNLIIHNASFNFHTCSDSVVAVINLLQYLIEEGDCRDLNFNSTNSTECEPNPKLNLPVRSLTNTSQELTEALDSAKSEKTEILKLNQTKIRDLKKKSLTGTRMMQSVYDQNNKKKSNSKTNKRMYESFSNYSQTATLDDDFCIIDEDEINVEAKEPQVNYFPTNYSIEIVDNYFRLLQNRKDQLRSPLDLPLPAYSYEVQSFDFEWCIYGGKDYDLPPGKSPNKSCGYRRNDTKVELQISKIQFLHEIFEEHQKEKSRTVLLVEKLEIRDRLQFSAINKMLYRNQIGEAPKQHSKMLSVKALLKKPAPDSTDLSCKLRVSLQPIRINIDQDTLMFLISFSNEVSSLLINAATTNENLSLQRCFKDDYSDIESVESNSDIHNNKCEDGIYFEEVVFSPEVPIRVDYNGKRVNVENGSLAGFLMGIASLNNSQLTLKRIINVRGKKGMNAVINYIINEWVNDIKMNQLPSILGGVGPLNSVVQLFQGMKDLVWMPIQQYKQDGRIVRGVRKGTASFGISTASATLEIMDRFVNMIQKSAETISDVVTPTTNNKKRKSNICRNKQISLAETPSDMTEGMRIAINVLRQGVKSTANELVEAVKTDHDQRGLAGAVGGVLSKIPSSVVKPVIIASEATSKVVQGLRNQITPNAKKEEMEKWVVE